MTKQEAIAGDPVPVEDTATIIQSTVRARRLAGKVWSHWATGVTGSAFDLPNDGNLDDMVAARHAYWRWIEEHSVEQFKEAVQDIN